MVESACRTLRDGALQGEFAPALMLLARSSPLPSAHALLLHFLSSLTSNIAAGTAQPKCVVVIAAERSPQVYQSYGVFKEEQHLRLRYVDCFTDPLGWRRILSEHKHLEGGNDCSPCHRVCHNLRDLNTLLSMIVQSGTLDIPNPVQFSVVIDSISAFLGHNPVEAVAKFLNNLRSHGKVSSIVWTLHSYLHDERVIKCLEYISSMVISIERLAMPVPWMPDESQLNTSKDAVNNEGFVRVRQKRRNGRIREQVEKFKVDGISLSLLSKIEGVEAGKLTVPQVQFRLHLSDKERKERAKVVLPFEHQGNGRESSIYNGRADATPPLLDTAMVQNDLCNWTGEDQSGQVHYLRDSDDERPDSDEDPDDDLDI